MPALFLAAVLLAASPTPSPSPSPSPLPVISTVRVATGSQQTLHALPVAAAALDRAAIASSAALTTDALLRTLPGFDRSRSNSMFTNYGQLRISFAGAGTDRGLMLADGIPAQDGFGGQVDWAAYPSSALQRAELLLGAGSALYGAGAVGGVLDVRTYAPPAVRAAPSGTISFAAGTRGYGQQWSNANASLGPKVSLAVSAQQQRLEYAALPPAYSSPIDRISQADASMAQVRVRYAATQRDVFEISQLGAWDDQFEGRQNYTFARHLSQTGLHYVHASLRSALEATVFSRSTFVLNLADQFPVKPGVLRYVQDVPVTESGASAMWNAGDLPFMLQVRADARHVRGENDQFGAGGALQSSGSGSQTFGGLAAQGTWRRGTFEALAGARFDLVNSYDQQINGKTQPDVSTAAVSPRIAFRYNLSPQVAVRASSGAGFRPPFLNELVRGFFIGSVSYQPNPSLVPERSITNSAGMDAVSARSRFALDAFDTRVTDAILFRTIDPAHQQRSNVGRTQTDGFTASFTQSLGTCSRISAWVTDQYARITAGTVDDVGKRLPYVPSQSGSVDYSGQIGRTGVGLSVSYLGSTYADDVNLQPLGSALVLGATVRVPLAGDALLTLSAQNLADARYLSSIDRYGPPSVLSMSVSLPIGPSQAQPPHACLP